MQLSDRQQNNKNEEKQQEINWNEFNYPPLLKLMHFRPSQIPKEKKRIVMAQFAIHITIFINTILNIINNCTEGGLGILYAFLFFFLFNPIILFLFYRSYMGLCKEKSMLSLFIYIQPLAIIVEIMVAIAPFAGFNGFVRVSQNFSAGNGFQGALGVITSIVYLVVAVLSGYLYFLIWKKRSILAKAFL